MSPLEEEKRYGLCIFTRSSKKKKKNKVPNYKRVAWDIRVIFRKVFFQNYTYSCPAAYDEMRVMKNVNGNSKKEASTSRITFAYNSNIAICYAGLLRGADYSALFSEILLIRYTRRSPRVTLDGHFGHNWGYAGGRHTRGTEVRLI